MEVISTESCYQTGTETFQDRSLCAICLPADKPPAKVEKAFVQTSLCSYANPGVIKT